MVMTFVLHPLSHYNSITEPRARFFLSLLEHLIIDFPSYFILSIIDVHRILHHFSVPFPVSDHFNVMGAIDAATVKRSEAQLCLRRSGLAAPPTPSTPFTFAPSSSAGGVTLDAIMLQLQRMDARLDNLSDELCQVNIRVGHIA